MRLQSLSAFRHAFHWKGHGRKLVGLRTCGNKALRHDLMGLSKDIAELNTVSRNLSDLGNTLEKPGEEHGPCTKCGKAEWRLVTGRVPRTPLQGPANIFQCISCGSMDWRDIPHQPPGKRT